MPTLLLDRHKCLKNIETMAKKAGVLGLKFRPHFKTHQSIEVGNWFRDFGVEAITVSSVRMADYFARGGFGDITVAFPVNPNEISSISELAGRVSLNLLVESEETAAVLGRGIGARAGVFIKIDTGYGRAGVVSKDYQKVDNIIREIGKSSKLVFKGFLTHAGHSYKAKSTEEILSIHSKSVAELVELKSNFIDRYPDAEVSVGDTPCCSAATDFAGVSEIRPGNFVFYDAMQAGLGSCRYDQIAVALACPVVANHPERNALIVHGGSTHLSLEKGETSSGESHYGLVVRLGADGWSEPIDGASVVGLSQEHGILSVTQDQIRSINIGEILGILPVHSCLAANLMRGYLSLDGRVVDHLQGRGFTA